MRPHCLVIGAITTEMHSQLETKLELHFVNDMSNPHEWLTEHGQIIRYIVTNGHDGVPPHYFDNLPALQLISNYGVGYDAIDVKEAQKRGIITTHTPTVLSEEVATTALLLMLACYRELSFNEAHLRSGRWQKEGNARLSRSADNRVVGIVGLGRIGEAIARKLEPFNADILYHNRNPKDVPYEYVAELEEMARRCDVLMIATPGGPSTDKLINKSIIEAVGDKGMIINVGRGSVIDEAALVDALQSGMLGAAGLDVFEKEPHVPDALISNPKLVLTPHMASATVETRAAMGQLVVDNLLQFMETGAVYTPVPECADYSQILDYEALS